MDNSPSTPPSPGAHDREASRRDGRALASSRRAAMRRRATRIRRSVAGLSLGVFTAAFLAVYVQLASGHDPALTSSKGSATVSSAAVAGSVRTTSSGSKAPETAATSAVASASGSGESSGAESDSSESSSPAAVTTSQS